MAPVARLLIEYDGRDFAGWAAQPGLRTVQAELERALGIVLRRDSVPLTVAGRTDRGVHALGQVASYPGSPANIDSVNALLPRDVAVVDCRAAPEGFDARVDATSRAYKYVVLRRRARSALQRGYVVHAPKRLDLDALHECAAALPGLHDFTAFTPKETEHQHFRRDISGAYWRVVDDRWEFHIEADAFLRHMNRVLVGTMLEVAGGRRTVDSFTRLLVGRPRSEAGRTAPAHGLYLLGVGYEGLPVLGATGSVRDHDADPGA